MRTTFLIEQKIAPPKKITIFANGFLFSISEKLETF